MAFFTLVYCLDLFTPTNSGLYLVGGGGGGGGAYFAGEIARFFKYNLNSLRPRMHTPA